MLFNWLGRTSAFLQAIFLSLYVGHVQSCAVVVKRSEKVMHPQEMLGSV